MLKENAVVIAYEQGIAKVKCQSQSACGQCSAKESCGTTSLSELNGVRGEHIFNIETITPLRVGQIVEIGLEERSMLFSALLLYIVPLLTLVATTLFSTYLTEQELVRAIFILFSTALSLFLVRIWTRKLAKQTEYQPVLLRVLN